MVDRDDDLRLAAHLGDRIRSRRRGRGDALLCGLSRGSRGQCGRRGAALLRRARGGAFMRGTTGMLIKRRDRAAVFAFPATITGWVVGLPVSRDRRAPVGMATDADHVHRCDSRHCGRAVEPRSSSLQGLPPVLARRARAYPRQHRCRPRLPPASTTRIPAIISGRWWPPSSVCPARAALPPAARGVALDGIGLWDAIERGEWAAWMARFAMKHRGMPLEYAARARSRSYASTARALPMWRDAGYATLVLPSSSPAYTRPFAEKLAAWQAIGVFLRRSASGAR